MYQNDPIIESDKPINVRLLIYKYLLRFWWLYIAGIALAAAGAWLYLRYTTPVYQVRATMLVKTPESNTGDVSQEFILGELGLTPPGSNLENEMQVLKSRAMMLEVVRRLNLNVIYQAEGRIKRGEQYLRSPALVEYYRLDEGIGSLFLYLDPHESDSNRLWIQRGENPPVEAVFGDTLRNEWGEFVFARNADVPRWSAESQIIVLITSPESIARSYAGRVTLKKLGEWSSVIELSLKDPIPQKAADVLNTLVEVYNESAIQEKNRTAVNTYEFINERLKSFTAELSESESELESFKTRNTIPGDIMTNVSNALDEFKATDAELSRLQLQLDIVDNLQAILRSGAGSYELLPANFAVENANLLGQTERYNELLLERSRRLRTLNDDHPSVLELNERITALRGVVLGTLRAVRGDIERKSETLRQKNRRLQGTLRSMPGIERELIEITRQKNIKENLYLYLLQKREEAAISMAVAAPNSRILDAAEPSNSPIQPKSQVSYALAFLLGLGIPLAVSVLADLLNDTVQSIDDIKNATEAPVAGGIGHSRTGEQVVVSRSSRSAVAEMFRLLRANLQFLHPDKDSQVWIVTSAASGEGKSFVSLNLGMTLAISGKRTAIVGMDLRKPKLIKYMGLDESSSQLRGVTHYLIGSAGAEEIIHPSSMHDKLFFIPSGPIPPNPAELLLQERTAELFAELRKAFDYVIVDTPPIGLVADALLLNPHITGALFLLREGVSKKGALQLIDDIYTQKKLQNLAIVLNGMGAKGGYGYAYAYSYSYGYSYGYGYGAKYGYYEEEKGEKRRRGRR